MTEITDDVQMSDPNDPHGEFKIEIKEGNYIPDSPEFWKSIGKRMNNNAIVPIFWNSA